MKNLWAATNQKNPEALVEKNVGILPQANVNKTLCEPLLIIIKKEIHNRIIAACILQPTGILHSVI
jgi:hypothetical protein